MREAQGEAILVVEDDPGVASLERRRLERAGYRAIVAATADEALEQLRGEPVQLILLDYRLPGGVDGLDFYGQLRAIGYDVPVILVTGFANEATIIAALRAGIRDVVAKSPEYLDYLPEAVTRVLNQVRTERRLAESESRLASIIASAKDAIIVTEADQRITLFNAAAEEMFRCPVAQALGQPLSRFIPQIASRRANPPQVKDSVIKQGNFGTHGVRGDGEEFPLEAAVSRATAAGRAFYTIVVRDVSERERAEQALRESEARWRSLSASSPMGIFLTDPDGRSLYSNPRCQAIMGFNLEESLGVGWARFLHPEDRERVVNEWFASAQTGREYFSEFRVQRPGGLTRWVQVRSAPLFLQHGRLGGHVGTLEDITDRHEAEERIREQAALIDKANDAILVHDLENRIRYWSRGAERLYGWSAAEALGQDANELLYESSTAALDEIRKLVLEKGEWAGELHQVCKAGHEVSVASRWTLVRDDRGEPKSILIINSDITEKKKLEAQYLHAQRMESVGTLAGGVAHDFNNLLTVITGYSEMLLGQARPDDPAHEALREIRKAAERASALTRQLLAFSRKQVLSPQVLDLNALVLDAEKLLRRLIGEDIDLATILDPNLGRVRVDPGQIEQVLMNLVVNARDAMPTGGHLTIETRNIDLDTSYASAHAEVRPGAYALLAVTDTGHGMDEATKSRIFEPFFTTKEVGRGTGLGLSTVFGIVKQSGGHIEVYSELGRGTTFKIYLPLLEEAGEARKASASAFPAPRGIETILLTEDEDGVRGLVGLALRLNGYTVLEARTGEEALRICEQYEGPIHLLMTDVVMPGMSGRQLANLLTPLRPAMKVMYLSGYTDEAVVRHGVLESGVAFLQKPFTPTVLARKVRQVLDQ